MPASKRTTKKGKFITELARKKAFQKKEKPFYICPPQKRARRTKKRGFLFFLKKSLSKMNLCKKKVFAIFMFYAPSMPEYKFSIPHGIFEIVVQVPNIQGRNNQLIQPEDWHRKLLLQLLSHAPLLFPYKTFPVVDTIIYCSHWSFLKSLIIVLEFFL